jgi:hypothetical protein
MFIAALLTIANYGSRQDVPLLMNGLRKCCIYTQWNFNHKEEWNFVIHKNGNGEHHLKKSYSGSESQKSHSLSYADYRPKTNAEILRDMGHILRENEQRGIGKAKEN